MLTKNSTLLRKVLLLSVATVLCSCASILRDGAEIFVVQTTPAGAEVTLSNGLYCPQTPCSFKVARRESFIVIIEKDGYKTTEHSIITSTSVAGGTSAAGNAIVGGIIGLGIDANTGAMLDHKPNPLIVLLEPIEGISDN